MVVASEKGSDVEGTNWVVPGIANIVESHVISSEVSDSETAIFKELENPSIHH